MKKAYLVDEGVLLMKEDHEFEGYSQVYDKKYGYYDESQYYVENIEKAVAEAKSYVKNGVEKTYAIVSTTVLPDDFDFDEGYVENETYLVDDVIYSTAKINGNIVENFINQKNGDVPYEEEEE